MVFPTSSVEEGTKEDSWVDRYYEALDFLYREPQNLGRAKSPNSKLNTLVKVQVRLRSMEVTLNHLLQQFLSLAPSSLRGRLFECGLGEPITGDLAMSGWDVDREYKLQNSNQPDFLFTTNDETFSLEMKIEAKSGCQQVLKYALLGLAVEHARDNRPMRHSVLFLGKGDFRDLWRKKGRYSSIDALKLVLETEKLSFLSGQPEHLRTQESRYFEIVSTLSVGFLSYDSLAALLAAEIDQADGSAGSQVYRKLLDGMLDELDRRRLTRPRGSICGKVPGSPTLPKHRLLLGHVAPLLTGPEPTAPADVARSQS